MYIGESKRFLSIISEPFNVGGKLPTWFFHFDFKATLLIL